MKRFLSLFMAFACVMCLSAGAWAEEVSLYEHGLEIVSLMAEMAQAQAYIEANTGNGEIRDIIAELANEDRSAPVAVYALKLPQEMLDEWAKNLPDSASEALRAALMRRALSAFAMNVNAMGGAETLAAANLLTIQKTFVCEGLEENVIYLYTYENAAPVAVAFTLGEDHTVTAEGTFMLLEDLEGYFRSAGVEMEMIPQ